MSAGHALITGGSSGIGLAIAHRLAARGMSLTLIARRIDGLERARKCILDSTAASNVRLRTADVADRAAISGAISSAIAELGPPALLVTSAGIVEPGYFDDVPLDAFERSIAVNYLGTVYAVKATLPSIRASRGRILMVSSGAGLIGLFGYTSYSPTKFALRGFAEALRAEVARDGVGVSIVFPPDTDTPQLADELRRRPPEAHAIARGAGVWTADAVAHRALRGLDRGDFAITPGLALTALYRLGSVLAPVLHRAWARKIAHAART